MKRLAILSLIVVVFMPITVWADMRINQRSSERNDFTFQNDEVYYYYEYREDIPSYLPDYPEVIQSLLVRTRFVDWDGTDTGWVESTLAFNPEVVYNQTGKQISYHDLIPGERRVEQYNQQGRLVSLSRYDMLENTPRYRITEFQYGAYGYPEIIIYGERTEAGFSQFEKFVSQIDANGLKLEETKYVSDDSLTWTPSKKYLLHHSGQMLPESFVMRKYNPLFDVRIFYYSYNSLQDCYQSGLYSRAMVDSVQTYEYNEGTWYAEELHYYNYGAYNNLIHIGVNQYDLEYMVYPDYQPSQFNYSFTPEGYLTGQYWGVDDGLAPPTWGSTTYTWELPTASDDPVLTPCPAPQISAYPNPFRQDTNLKLRITAPGEIKLGIYNLRGQLVRNLVEEFRTEGTHNITWDGRDGNGRELAPGIYFLKLESGGSVTSSKLIHLR